MPPTITFTGNEISDRNELMRFTVPDIRALAKARGIFTRNVPKRQLADAVARFEATAALRARAKNLKAPEAFQLPAEVRPGEALVLTEQRAALIDAVAGEALYHQQRMQNAREWVLSIRADKGYDRDFNPVVDTFLATFGLPARFAAGTTVKRDDADFTPAALTDFGVYRYVMKQAAEHASVIAEIRRYIISRFPRYLKAETITQGIEVIGAEPFVPEFVVSFSITGGFRIPQAKSGGDQTVARRVIQTAVADAMKAMAREQAGKTDGSPLESYTSSSDVSVSPYAGS